MTYETYLIRGLLTVAIILCLWLIKNYLTDEAGNTFIFSSVEIDTRGRDEDTSGAIIIGRGKTVWKGDREVYAPLVIQKGGKLVVEGTLTLHGKFTNQGKLVVGKSFVAKGEAGNNVTGVTVSGNIDMSS